MPVTAAIRDRTRRLTGALLISLGTAVFSGAVAVVVDALINDKPLHWIYAAVLTAAGLILSSGGAWLLATLKTAVGLSVTTIDVGGDPERYQDEADTFARFGQSTFNALTSIEAAVEQPTDLRAMRTRVLAALRTLTQVHHQVTSIGLLFQGRQHVGFYLGTWLNVAGRRIDLYTDARNGTTSHFPAVRLTPAIQAEPRAIDIAVHLVTDGVFQDAQSVTALQLRELLASRPGQCMGLAINLNGPVDEASLVKPARQSALAEGATALIVAALPAPLDRPEAPRRELAPTRQAYESAISAVLAVADAMPASPGLLYLKTPASIAVALGHFLRAGIWTPMRLLRSTGTYDRFPEPTRR